MIWGRLSLRVGPAQPGTDQTRTKLTELDSLWANSLDSVRHQARLDPHRLNLVNAAPYLPKSADFGSELDRRARCVFPLPVNFGPRKHMCRRRLGARECKSGPAGNLPSQPSGRARRAIEVFAKSRAASANVHQTPSCGGPRHFRPEFKIESLRTLGRATCSKAEPMQVLQMQADAIRNRAQIGRNRRTLVECGTIDVSRPRPNSGRIPPDLRQSWSKFGQTRSNLASLGRNWAGVGVFGADIG